MIVGEPPPAAEASAAPPADVPPVQFCVWQKENRCANRLEGLEGFQGLQGHFQLQRIAYQAYFHQNDGV